MKIEMVLPCLAAAGMETIVARLCRRLDDRGHDVGVTCIEARGALAGDLESKGIRVALVPTPRVATNVWPRALSSHLARVAPDVLHIHSGAWLKGAMAGRQSRTPFLLYTAHGVVDPEPWQNRYFERAGALLTHRVVAVSEHLKTFLSARGIPARKIDVIINGVDTSAFRPAPPEGRLRQKLGIDADTMVVGTVARLEPVKNQAMLIHAVARARGGGCDCEAVLVGDGPLRPDLERRARDAGVGDRIHFWGYDEDVSRIYPEFDVFALTSTIEGTSISMLEAMASAVCPVATAVGGNVDLLGGGSSGVLVPRDEAGKLAEVLGALAGDPERRDALGRAARARVETRFSETSMVDRYEELYRHRRLPRADDPRPEAG